MLEILKSLKISFEKTEEEKAEEVDLKWDIPERKVTLENYRKCKEILKNHGIEPNWDETLKEIASSYGIKPKEIILWLTEGCK